jgi:hypothetical protein
MLTIKGAANPPKPDLSQNAWRPMKMSSSSYHAMLCRDPEDSLDEHDLTRCLTSAGVLQYLHCALKRCGADLSVRSFVSCFDHLVIVDQCCTQRLPPSTFMVTAQVTVGMGPQTPDGGSGIESLLRRLFFEAALTQKSVEVFSALDSRQRTRPRPRVLRI